MSTFPAKILLATDGSEDSGVAASAAIELANDTGAELHVVHVGESHLVHPAPTAGGPPMPAPSKDEIRQIAQSVLDHQVQEITESGGKVEDSHLRLGRPAEEIVALSEEMGAGVIIVGSRGMSALRRALMGSVSDSVVRHAHCPVFVVRG